jgi:hypothetical protein
MDRLKRLRDRMAKFVRLRGGEREEQRKKREAAEHAQRVRRNERERVFAEIHKELERESPDRDRINKLRERVEELSERAEASGKKARHHGTRIENLTSRIRWALARRTNLRKRIERKRAERDPRPESWMANGHEFYNLTPKAKDLLAVAVIKYGLVCTSITRSWGTGSYHEDTPTHGFDCAGGRMITFQNDLRYGKIEGFPLGSILELFGPDNSACADNGAPYYLSEGSGLEQLHDNHVHAFVYG